MRPIARQLVTLGVTVLFVLGALLFNASKLSFLLDPTLGGRAGEFSQVHSFTLLPVRPGRRPGGDRSLLRDQPVRLLGGVALTLIFLMPLVLAARRPSMLRDPIRRAAMKGLLVYFIVMNLDGALNFIPTMVFYWFTTMVFIYGLPPETLPHPATAIASEPVRRRRRFYLLRPATARSRTPASGGEYSGATVG